MLVGILQMTGKDRDKHICHNNKANFCTTAMAVETILKSSLLENYDNMEVSGSLYNVSTLW